MTNKSTLTALVAALAVTTGGLGLSLTGVFDQDGLTGQDSGQWVTSNTANGLMMGHLVVEAHDENGNLTAYRQSDNEVVDDGEQCILKMLFNSAANDRGAAGSQACSGANTSAWDIIAIGTGSTAAADTDLLLGNETSTTAGLERAKTESKTWTNGTGATTTKIVLSKQFTLATGASDHTIAESGLFNDPTVATNGMLARQTFTGVALSAGDSITITWTFTVGN